MPILGGARDNEFTMSEVDAIWEYERESPKRTAMSDLEVLVRRSQ